MHVMNSDYDKQIGSPNNNGTDSHWIRSAYYSLQLRVRKQPLRNEFTFKDLQLKKFSHWKWSEFIEAVKQVSSDLDIPEEAVNMESEVYEPEFFYSASSQRAKLPNFTFHVDYTRRARNPKSPQLYATLEVDFADHTPAFYIRDALGDGAYPPDCIIRWVALAVHQFNLKHNPTNLESLFGETSIRVYGLPHYSDPTITEMQLLMRGLRSTKSRVIVHRFRHLREGDWYRSYSYAVWAQTDYHGHWVFFHEAGGLDSGAAHRDMELMEQLILDLGKRVKVKNHDIESSVLERFLLKKCEGFESMIRDSDLALAHRLALDDGLESTFGSEFSKHLRNMEMAYEKEDYTTSLRDLRVLMQEALEQVAKLRKVQIADISSPNISKLADKLKNANVIDELLLPWFHAFTTIANLSTHRLFPSREDLKDSVIRMRVLACFVIGRQLLLELEACASKERPHATRSDH
jgi:hypothetical protein